MPQTLKEDIRNRIKASAVDNFYKYGFRSCTMKRIAQGADIPAGLIYSYFKNKEDLFETILEPVHGVLMNINRTEVSYDDPYKTLYEEELPLWLHCLEKYHREMVILIDKSGGSSLEGTKEKIIEEVTVHLKMTPVFLSTSFDGIFYHILANNFMEGLFEVARHYQDRPWAEEMLDLLILQHLRGAEGVAKKA